MYNENIKYALFLTRIDVSGHFDMSVADVNTNGVHYSKSCVVMWLLSKYIFLIFSIEHRPLPS